ncbi:hypothetical protein DL98DRAFT_511272 [Cadophora sp. DSE1049]|nr:hypothetical protein DL98DRAFT_511272 [Cadophora sp. DSE1049]
MSPPGPEDTTKSRHDGPNKKFKPSSVSFSDPKALVTFIIGPEGHTTEFIVHKEVAYHHSKVFEAAFNSQLVEGSTQTYRLADTSESAFKFMMQWLYSQKFNLLHHDPSHEVDTNTEGKDCSQDMYLTELWVLGDRFGMPALQNAVLDSMQSIVDHHRGYLPLCTYSYIYDNTTDGSLLRQYVVSSYYKQCNSGSIRRHRRWIPYEMLVDISDNLFPKKKYSIYTFDVEDFYVEDHDH